MRVGLPGRGGAGGRCAQRELPPNSARRGTGRALQARHRVLGWFRCCPVARFRCCQAACGPLTRPRGSKPKSPGRLRGRRGGGGGQRTHESGHWGQGGVPRCSTAWGAAAPRRCLRCTTPASRAARAHNAPPPGTTAPAHARAIEVRRRVATGQPQVAACLHAHSPEVMPGAWRGESHASHERGHSKGAILLPGSAITTGGAFHPLDSAHLRITCNPYPPAGGCRAGSAQAGALASCEHPAGLGGCPGRDGGEGSRRTGSDSASGPTFGGDEGGSRAPACTASVPSPALPRAARSLRPPTAPRASGPCRMAGSLQRTRDQRHHGPAAADRGGSPTQYYCGRLRACGPHATCPTGGRPFAQGRPAARVRAARAAGSMQRQHARLGTYMAWRTQSTPLTSVESALILIKASLHGTKCGLTASWSHR